ncbi:MAG TPA: HD domain-containing protein [Deinococcales bacterium]|nr:HD domain-containing protein [Deinococcales bacterium]
MNREEAWKLVQDHTPSESLRRHMLAVEAAMRWYARHYGQDEETWAVTGLLHDFDYEQHPDEHPYWGVQHLRERGVGEEILQAILGHATFTGTARESLMAKALFAVDELTGLITATALVRPDRSVANLEASSVLKRMKDKAFARGVNRDDVRNGAAELGMELPEHVQNVIAAMRELGSRGA